MVSCSSNLLLLASLLSTIVSNCSTSSAFIQKQNFVHHRIQKSATLVQQQSKSSETEILCLISEDDKKKVTEQLGYIPPNVLSISARNSSGDPIAIKTYPLGGGASRRMNKAAQDKTPFPTLYWLTCKKISKALANLEREGVLQQFEERIVNQEEDAHIKMRKAHEEYAQERWDTLTEQDKHFLLNNGETKEGFVKMLRDSGVAGTQFRRKDGSVPYAKCLHAHYAHFVSSPNSSNIVGKWAHELLKERFPDCL